MTDETIELRTTERGMQYFRRTDGALWTTEQQRFTDVDMPSAIAEAAAWWYPAGEPCDT